MKKLIVILAFFCSCTPQLYETYTPLINSLPVRDWCRIEYAEPVYTLTIQADKGDILMITGDAEVTTELPYNICLCSAIYVNGNPVSGFNGCNINKSRHHETIQRDGHYEVPEDGKYTISLMAYCASTDAKLGHTIKVEGYDPKNKTHYGKLSVVRLGANRWRCPGCGRTWSKES